MMGPGSTLGHYEILSELGKGGMGEVYRARDTKLGREVAIKVLPSQFAQDAERLARLEREARMLAALNHPNIAAIYGLEQSDDTRFLVLELVEGDTLADRLRTGPVRIAEALKLALQIAEALEVAHEKGVIHRDLKPANIKITPEGRVKVLDFGLAKAFIGDQPDVNLSNSPTLSMAATQAGIILGTAGYMSPEQARGEGADQRADVWAFGVVVFEMLAGRTMFEGRTVSDVLAGVLAKSPSWESLPPNLHPRLRQMLDRCLAKEPKDRYAGIGDARVDVAAVLSEPGQGTVVPLAEAVTATRPALLAVLPWAIAAAVLASALVWFLRPSPVANPGIVTRFDQELTEGNGFRNVARDVVAISPDSRYFAYNTQAGLFLRTMDDLEPRLIPGTETALTNPFFSPDGEWIGYWDGASGQLRRIPIGGGSSITLTPALNPQGASWGRDGAILFGQPAGIMRVSEDGGEPALIVAAGPGEQLWDPQLLPDGRVLFSVRAGAASSPDIAVARPGTDERTVLFAGDRAVYLSSGHLVVSDIDASPNAVLARTFDLATLEVGGAVPMVEGVAVGQGKTRFAVSESGSLVYGVGTGAATSDERSLVWVDRGGDEEEIPIPPGGYESPRVSPDGTRVVMSFGPRPARDIWLWDITTENAQRLTFDPADESNPVWSPDGEEIFFVSEGDGSSTVYAIAPEGGEPRPVASSTEFKPLPMSVSPDGERLAVSALYANTFTGLATVATDGGGEFETVLYEGSGDFAFNEPMISPNGEWLAYYEGELGDPRVYVRPFPGVQQTQRPVSNVFSLGPTWSGDGTELFFSTGDGIWVVAVDYDPFRIGEPELLFRGAYRYGNINPGGAGGRAWDWDPVGQRFLMVRPFTGVVSGDQDATPRMNVVVNWIEELKARVPVP